MKAPLQVPVGSVGAFVDAEGHRFVGLAASEHAVREVGPGDLPLEVSGGLSVRDLLDNWDEVAPLLPEVARQAGGRHHDAGSLIVLSPVAPRQVLQSGANYRQHVIDLAMAHRDPVPGQTEEEAREEVAAMMDRRAAGGDPYLFVGLPSSVCGPEDALVLPAYSDQHDWELELAVVIGRRARHIDASEALDYVAGYTICNDITTRDLVFRKDMPAMGTDWFRGKCAPGFLPTGPFLVPAQLVSDPHALQITLRVNDQVMQDESTSDMVFGIPALVSAATSVAELWPGDLILTGSPAGNGMGIGRFLRPNDVMTGTITSLGSQLTPCTAPNTSIKAESSSRKTTILRSETSQ